MKTSLLFYCTIVSFLFITTPIIAQFEVVSNIQNVQEYRKYDFAGFVEVGEDIFYIEVNRKQIRASLYEDGAYIFQYELDDLEEGVFRNIPNTNISSSNFTTEDGKLYETTNTGFITRDIRTGDILEFKQKRTYYYTPSYINNGVLIAGEQFSHSGDYTLIYDSHLDSVYSISDIKDKLNASKFLSLGDHSFFINNDGLSVYKHTEQSIVQLTDSSPNGEISIMRNGKNDHLVYIDDNQQALIKNNGTIIPISCDLQTKSEHYISDEYIIERLEAEVRIYDRINCDLIANYISDYSGYRMNVFDDEAIGDNFLIQIESGLHGSEILRFDKATESIVSNKDVESTVINPYAFYRSGDFIYCVNAFFYDFGSDYSVGVYDLENDHFGYTLDEHPVIYGFGPNSEGEIHIAAQSMAKNAVVLFQDQNTYTSSIPYSDSKNFGILRSYNPIVVDDKIYYQWQDSLYSTMDNTKGITNAESNSSFARKGDKLICLTTEDSSLYTTIIDIDTDEVTSSQLLDNYGDNLNQYSSSSAGSNDYIMASFTRSNLQFYSVEKDEFIDFEIEDGYQVDQFFASGETIVFSIRQDLSMFKLFTIVNDELVDLNITSEERPNYYQGTDSKIFIETNTNNEESIHMIDKNEEVRQIYTSSGFSPWYLSHNANGKVSWFYFLEGDEIRIIGWKEGVQKIWSLPATSSLDTKYSGSGKVIFAHEYSDLQYIIDFSKEEPILLDIEGRLYFSHLNSNSAYLWMNDNNTVNIYKYSFDDESIDLVNEIDRIFAEAPHFVKRKSALISDTKLLTGNHLNPSMYDVYIDEPHIFDLETHEYYKLADLNDNNDLYSAPIGFIRTDDYLYFIADTPAEGRQWHRIEVDMLSSLPLVDIADHSLSVYPSLTSTSISLDQSGTKVQISSTNGKTVGQIETIQKGEEIDVSSLAVGMYYITIMNQDHKRVTASFIKN